MHCQNKISSFKKCKLFEHLFLVSNKFEVFSLYFKFGGFGGSSPVGFQAVAGKQKGQLLCFTSDQTPHFKLC